MVWFMRLVGGCTGSFIRLSIFNGLHKRSWKLQAQPARGTRLLFLQPRLQPYKIYYYTFAGQNITSKHPTALVS